jgi:hypothetical protein
MKFNFSIRPQKVNYGIHQKKEINTAASQSVSLFQKIIFMLGGKRRRKFKSGHVNCCSSGTLLTLCRKAAPAEWRGYNKSWLLPLKKGFK